MCEQREELIGEHYSTFPDRAQAEARRDGYLAEIKELIRAKTGRDCEAVPIGTGLTGFRLLDTRAFGVLPGWCRRRIDRADPRKLAVRFDISPCADESEIHFVARIYELPTIPT